MSTIITFAGPCYNSAAYMDHCVQTLLSGGADVEIILVDDGSTKDETPAICDRYAAEYPDRIRVIHQENSGHGEGVNQGLRHARGLYYKVVDSDDWLDEAALSKALDQQVRVTKLMIDAHNVNKLYQEQRKLARYMVSYLSMMMTISSIFLIIDGSPAALGKKTELWEYLRTVDSDLYHKLKYRSVSMVGNVPGYQGRKLSVHLYRLARRIYKFN